MANITINAIKEAEKSANQIIVDSKEQCSKILGDANEQKKQLIANSKIEIANENQQIIQKAEEKSQAVKLENSSKIQQKLEELEQNYSNKKTKAISELVQQVLA